MTKKASVRFYFDIGCPYSFLAFSEIEAILSRCARDRAGAREEEVELTLSHVPILSSSLPPSPSPSPAKLRILQRDLMREACRNPGVGTLLHPDPVQRYFAVLAAGGRRRGGGLPLWSFPRTMAALAAVKDPDDRRRWTRTLFRWIWLDGQGAANDDDNDDRIHDRLVTGCNPSNPGNGHCLLESPTKMALEAGMFATPTFHLTFHDDDDNDADRTASRIVYGHDRLFVLERLLRWGDANKALSTPIPWSLPTRPFPRQRRRRRRSLTYFYDFSSPYAYVADRRLTEEILPRHQSQQDDDNDNDNNNDDNDLFQFEAVPIVLGGLFQLQGTPNAPLLIVSEARRRYVQQDLDDCLGLLPSSSLSPETIVWPKVFPIRTVTALRATLVEPRLRPVLFRAAWGGGGDHVDLGDESQLRRCITDAGFDGNAIVDRAKSDPTVKRALFRNTQRAHDLGCCGVPSFVVTYNDNINNNNREDGTTHTVAKVDVIFGQDRLHVVDDLLFGWKDPSAGYNGHPRTNMKKTPKHSKL